MNDSQPSDLIRGVRIARRAIAVARDVSSGTDGDPVAAAQLLAEVVNFAVKGARDVAGDPGDRGRIRNMFLEAAPSVLNFRITRTDDFEEIRALMAEFGLPGVMDDLPSGWGSVSMDGVGATRVIHDDSAEGDEDDEEDEEDEEDEREPVNLTQLVVETLYLQGVEVTAEQAYAVVDRLLDVLGIEVDDETDDDQVPDPIEVVSVAIAPRTPWTLDFQPVPTALHVNTVPEDVRVCYSAALKDMIIAMDLHPDAVVHAVFIPEMRLAHLPNAVVLEAGHREKLKRAWERFPDPAGWGPAEGRPLAIWYPVARTPMDGPF